MIRVLLSGICNDVVELHLVRALRESGIHVLVIDHPASPAVEWCRAEGVPHCEHSFKNRFDRRAVALYRDILRGHEVDIIHCLTNRALSTALLAIRNQSNYSKIVAYRGTAGHLHRWDPASRLSYLSPRVNGIVCVSDAVRRYLKGIGIPDARLEVIWKGHDPIWYSSATRTSFSELGIPPNATVVGFVGNIRPVKGVDYLLRAFDQTDARENIHLVVIGEVRDLRIAKQVGRNPRVHFMGYRSDAARLSGACDIAVMPSVEREGLPKAVIEAMAQGVPPVVTGVGGLPELVEDGKCGLVVPPGDAAALCTAIRKLAQDADLRRRMGIAARVRIEGPFHFRHTVTKTIALYQRLLV